MIRFFTAALLCLCTLTCALAAEAPAPSEFSWRATLTMPAGASVARVSLPAQALVQLQSREAHDIRVFNAEGEAVAFALVAPPPAALAVAQTRAYPALPLFAAANTKQATKGAVQVQLEQSQGGSAVWVRFDEAGKAATTPEASATRLPSVLFDTRSEKTSLSGLTLQAEFPANALVHFSLASSSDLLHWTPLALRGPLFRFEGENAPANTTLELAQPYKPEGRYLRLSWDAQANVQVKGFTGTLAPAWIAPSPVRASLPAGLPDGATALTWPIDFATPLAALHLSSSRPNTLVPVRILGRNDSSQPWRLLGQTVVYRIGSAGQESSNPPVALGYPSVRWLRVEATNGMTLPSADVQATAEFAPIELLVLASGKAPFELALGRTHTSASAVAPSMLTQVVKDKLEDLPRATLTDIRLTPHAASAGPLQRVLPVGTEQRSVVLWAVLLAGVLVLALVAYALMRQLSAKPGQTAAAAGGTDQSGKN
jgi:hypothetical protein